MSEDTRNELHEALKICEKIPQRQFAQLLRRLAIALKDRDQVPFSPDEVKYMLEHFSLTPSEIDSLFSSCQYMMQQAACFSFNPEKMQAYASSSGVSDEIAECFFAVWETEGSDLIDALKSRTLTDHSLDSTGWSLHIKAADKETGTQRKPCVIFDLNVANSDPIKIQFDHEGFSRFYDQIEQIQQQIDRLT